MPHFLIKKEQISNNIIELVDDENFFHLAKVLRVKVNEKIKFIDNKQNIYVSLITEINKKSLKAKIIEQFKTNRFLKNNICLIQSILMNDAQNLLIANATQTGVKEIYPVITDNTSPSLSALKNKIEKWQKIAYENFKQCERADEVKINEISNLQGVLSEFKKENIIIYSEGKCNIKLDECIKKTDKNDKIAVVIGPEGGFSNDEFEYFKKENFNQVSLGLMIYKAPNAVVAGISNIVSRLEDNV